MDMKKIQELPTPEDLKKEFPLPYKVQKIKKQRESGLTEKNLPDIIIFIDKGVVGAMT